MGPTGYNMAEEDKDADVTVEEADAEAEDQEQEEGGRRKLSGKFIVLFIALPLFLIVGGGGGAAYLFGVFDAPMKVDGQEVVVVEPEKPRFYYDLPEMLVNLSSQKRNSQFLKLQVALEIADKGVTDSLEPQLPRILDTFQIYLRQLRSEDLEGSAGVYRLKEELLKRINLAIAPQRVDRVLFKEIIIQ
jgi:flagellar protein FliL